MRKALVSVKNLLLTAILFLTTVGIFFPNKVIADTTSIPLSPDGENLIAEAKKDTLPNKNAEKRLAAHLWRLSESGQYDELFSFVRRLRQENALREVYINALSASAWVLGREIDCKGGSNQTLQRFLKIAVTDKRSFATLNLLFQNISEHENQVSLKKSLGQSELEACFGNLLIQVMSFALKENILEADGSGAAWIAAQRALGFDAADDRQRAFLRNIAYRVGHQCLEGRQTDQESCWGFIARTYGVADSQSEEHLNFLKKFERKIFDFSKNTPMSIVYKIGLLGPHLEVTNWIFRRDPSTAATQIFAALRTDNIYIKPLLLMSAGRLAPLLGYSGGVRRKAEISVYLANADIEKILGDLERELGSPPPGVAGIRDLAYASLMTFFRHMGRADLVQKTFNEGFPRLATINFRKQKFGVSVVEKLLYPYFEQCLKSSDNNCLHRLENHLLLSLSLDPYWPKEKRASSSFLKRLTARLDELRVTHPNEVEGLWTLLLRAHTIYGDSANQKTLAAYGRKSNFRSGFSFGLNLVRLASTENWAEIDLDDLFGDSVASLRGSKSMADRLASYYLADIASTAKATKSRGESLDSMLLHRKLYRMFRIFYFASLVDEIQGAETPARMATAAFQLAMRRFKEDSSAWGILAVKHIFQPRLGMVAEGKNRFARHKENRELMDELFVHFVDKREYDLAIFVQRAIDNLEFLHLSEVGPSAVDLGARVLSDDAGALGTISSLFVEIDLRIARLQSEDGDRGIQDLLGSMDAKLNQAIDQYLSGYAKKASASARLLLADTAGMSPTVTITLRQNGVEVLLQIGPEVFSFSKDPPGGSLFTFLNRIRDSYSKRESAKAQPISDINKVNAMAFRLFFADISQKIPNVAGTTLRLAVDSSIADVPFEAIWKSQPMTTNIGVVRVVNAPSALAFRLTSHVDLVGSSLGGLGLGPLPEVKNEIAGIAGEYRKRFQDKARVSLSLNANFTQAALVKGFQGGGSVLHVATHYVDDVSGSFLLSGEKRRISALDLWKSLKQPGDSKLVVLSACETGVGSANNASATSNITKVFLRKGATYVLSSLWRVSDQASSRFMKHFYRILLESGDPIAALDATKLYFRTFKDEFSAPFFWAGYAVWQGH